MTESGERYKNAIIRIHFSESSNGKPPANLKENTEAFLRKVILSNANKQKKTI